MSKGIEINLQIEGFDTPMFVPGKDWKGRPTGKDVFNKAGARDLNELTYNVGRDAAEQVIAKFKKLLDDRNFIATGKSKDNHIAEYVKGKRFGLNAWQVKLGGNATGNIPIRYGIEPGNAPSISALRGWVGSHNSIKTLIHPDDYGLDADSRTKEKGGVSIVRGYTTKKGTKVDAYGRTKYGKSKRSTTSALYAIQNKLQKFGTLEDIEHRWRPYYPVDEGRFDYVTYGLDHIEIKTSDVLKDAAQIYANYLGSTRKKNLNLKLIRFLF